jgi:hypothetical protein
MIIWLASYPRSGNTFFRILLHHLFGLQTHSVYSAARLTERYAEDARMLMSLTGQLEVECNLDLLHADSGIHIVKTHDLPTGDSSPAIVLIRDGRDAVVSYARYVLKTEHGIERPGVDLFETTLRQLIVGDNFGGWSKNVNAWTERVGRDNAIRYEDLIEDPVDIVARVLQRLGVETTIGGATFPRFQELHATVPWFFRRGKTGSWREEMPSHLQELFMERHGGTLLRFGYSEQAAA